MQVNDLNLLKELQTLPHYAALRKLFEGEEKRMILDLVTAASEFRVRQLQGGIHALNQLWKLIEDAELLRSLQDNPNVDPANDKE